MCCMLGAVKEHFSQFPWKQVPEPNRWQRSGVFLFFRVVSFFSVAVLALSFPAVGPNRFLLAGIILFISIPLVLFAEWRFRIAENGWGEPLHDLLLILVLVNLVPAAWYAALVLGLMVAMAPSIGSNPQGYKYYAGMGALLVVGMSTAAIVHHVEHWEIPILAIVAIYPSLTYYSYWVTSRSNALRHTAEALDNLAFLSGGVAHDFNNILTAISGHAELALMDLPDNSAAAESIEEVLEGARRASHLSGQLLAFSGKGLTTEEPVDLAKELSLTVSLMRSAIAKGISLDLEIQPDLPAIQGDRSQIQQVIMNVLMNAAEAITETPASIRITLGLESPTGELSFRESEKAEIPKLALEISDPGPGISPELLPRLFEPFITTKARGHGLGLASAQRIMDDHGGTIRVESEVGAGTHVNLVFPAAEEPSATPDEVSHQLPSGAQEGGCVLVIDDEAQIRSLLQRLLRRLGFDTLVAPDGDQGVALFKQHRRELRAVILDLKMPGKDGWQVLDEIRVENSDMPVVLCSGFNPESDQRMERYRHVTSMSKPFRLDELGAVLDRLSSQSLSGPAASGDPVG